MSVLGGDWELLYRTLQGMSDRANELNEILQEYGDEVVRKIKEHIDSNDLGWPPLSDITVRIKGHDQILVESGTLRDSFSAEVLGGGDSYEVVLKIDGSNEWLSNAELMEYIEFGTSRMPARPLVRPTLEEMKERVGEIELKIVQFIVEGG